MAWTDAVILLVAFLALAWMIGILFASQPKR